MALCNQILQAQILEEMTVAQFGKHIDSLIANESIVEAYYEFYTYTNFTPTYNKRIPYKNELLDLRNRVEEAKLSIVGISKKELFAYNKPLIDNALEERNHQKALLIAGQFKDELEVASDLFNKIEKMLPMDSIQVYGSSFPYQLFTSPQLLTIYNSNSISENTLVYLKKDSSLFKGVIISSQNEPMSMETGIAWLDYDRFENGKRVERKRQGFVFSNSLHKNQLFFGHDSNHYRLNYMTLDNLNDTIRSYVYGNPEELIKETVLLNQIYDGIKTIKEIEYNSDESIKKWKELAPISEKHSQYDTYSCWVNQFGDTISEEFVLVKGELEITQQRTFNSNGDTISLSRTVNSFIDGLQIENRYSSDGFNFELRSVFDNGTVIDILTDSVLYFNEDWDIISKEDYIMLMNQGGDDFIYFESGIFNEYFPDVDFKSYPYFIAVSYVVTKSFKKFKKSVKKYFKVKV